MSAIAGLLRMALPDSGLLSPDYGQGNAPNGMFGAPQQQQQPDALFTPEELKRARPGIMGRLAALSPSVAGPADQYRANLDRILKMKEMTAGMAQQRKLQSTRESIASQFPAAEGESGEQAVERMKRMFAAYVAAGDMESAGKVGEVIKSIGQPRAPQALQPRTITTEDGRIFQWDAEARKWNDTGMKGAQRSDPTLVPVQQPDGSLVYTRRGEAAGQNAPSPTGKGSAAIAQKVVENKTQIAIIDDAFKQLDKHEAAVGPKRGVGEVVPFLGGVQDMINQQIDPEGIDARAQISNIGSLKIHDRSGAAVTVAEMPRLRPFIPSVGDTPQAVRRKLKLLRAALILETDLLNATTGRTAAPGKPAPAAPAPGGKPTYEQWKQSQGVP